MPKSGMSNRYSNMSGLADANYNIEKFTLAKPTDMAAAMVLASRYNSLSTQGKVGEFTAPPVKSFSGCPFVYPVVYNYNSKLYVVTHNYDQGAAFGMNSTNTQTFRPGMIPWNVGVCGMEFIQIAELKPKTSTRDEVTPKVPDTDCPPPDNCTEKWIDKTLYVSAKPVKDAIEIPVAFKKLVCEGESTEDPQVDCEELLKALEQSVSEGQVPGMVNGLGAVPANYPPDWCKDCEEKLVKASAYVTDFAVSGSKPFKVKVKVLVCETSAEPKIDCEEVIKALGAGMRAKKMKTVNGLSEASMTTSNAASSKGATSGKEFDEEANRVTPGKEVKQASFPWWMWLILGGTALYAARKL